MQRTSERRNFVISYFHCPFCNWLVTVPRRKENLRPINHIKTLYCPNCRKEFDGIENDLLTMEEAEQYPFLPDE